MIKNWLIKRSLYSGYRQFEKDCQDPETVYLHLWQNEILPLLKCGNYWSDKWKPALEDYSITSYSDYKASLENSLASPFSELTGEPVLFWAQSAGTTGSEKFFPVTPSFRTQFQRTLQPYLYSISSRHTGLFKRPVLYMAAIESHRYSAAGIEMGFISNFNYRLIPDALKNLYVTPYACFCDASVFRRFATVYALASDLSGVFAVVPMGLKSFISTIRENWLAILAYLRKQKPLPLYLPPIAITKSRLKYLESLSPAALTFEALWPSMQFVACWKSSVCQAQLALLQQDLGNIDVVDAIYAATEGWCNVPMAGMGQGGPIHPRAHILEFLPIGAAPMEANLLKPWQLTAGEIYELFFTTAMGLVRYRIFDAIKCTGFFRKSPIVEFVEKSDRSISIGLVCISELELVKACLAVGISLDVDTCFAPNYAGNGLTLYTWRKELPDWVAKLQCADGHLQEMNAVYRKYSNTDFLRPLSMATLPQEHAFWTRKVVHAQTKPGYLMQTAPAH